MARAQDRPWLNGSLNAEGVNWYGDALQWSGESREMPPLMRDLTLVGIAALALLLFYFSVARPRLFLYIILIAVPTQFFFIPVSNFFLSPADGLIIVGGLSFGLLLITGDGPSWQSVLCHRWIFLMIAGYVVGFALLGELSRTLIRVPMAIVPSLLATTYLRTARSVTIALICMVVGGAGDAIYGVAAPLYGGTRFTAIEGVNFDAMIMLAAAAVAWALWADVPRLLGASALTAAGAATLSRAGLIAFLAALGSAVLPVLRAKGRALALGMVLILGLVAFNVRTVRERILARLEEHSAERAGAKTSVEIRVMVIRAALHAFVDHPVTGLGFNGFLDYSILDPEIAQVSLGEGVYTHDTPLEILAEGGMLAFAPFVMYVSGLLGVAVILWRRAWRFRDRLSSGALAALVVVLIVGLFANVLLHYSVWAVVGIALACSRLAMNGKAAGGNVSVA